MKKTDVLNQLNFVSKEHFDLCHHHRTEHHKVNHKCWHCCPVFTVAPTFISSQFAKCLMY